MKKYSILLVFILFVSSCGKDGIFSIFDDQEHMVQKTIALHGFNYLKLESDFNVYLIQDTVDSVKVECDESIIGSVTTTITDTMLEINNSYKPKWLKPKINKVNIYLKFKLIRKIEIDQPCNVQTMNTINSDDMGVVYLNKLGDANLDINCNSFYYWNANPCGGRLTLSGNTNKLVIWNYALMSVDARNLESNVVYVENHAQGDCWVRPINSLTYAIYGTGNIYYYGNPTNITKGVISSTGRLIKEN